MAKAEVEIFETIRDTLSPFGINTEIAERRGNSMSLWFTKPPERGRRTLHLTVRKDHGDPRVRHNQIADAKRLCREAGWITVDAKEPERVPVGGLSDAVSLILGKKPEPALGVALRESLMGSTIIQEAEVEEVRSDSEPKASDGVVLGQFTQVSNTKPPKTITGKVGVYAAGPGRSASFSVVIATADMTPHMLEQFWAPYSLAKDVVTMKPSTRGTRRWHQYNNTPAFSTIRFDIAHRSPLLDGGVYGLSDCLIEIGDDETITILTPDQDRRDVRQRAAEQEQPPMLAKVATPPIATPQSVADRNPIDVLREAKETINAMRKKVPGLVVGVTPDGDVEFTVKI